MKTLTLKETDLVSGGCAEHCWGDFSLAGLTATMAASALSGARSGFGGMIISGFAGGLAYAGGKVGDKMSQRTTSTSDE